MAGIAEDPAAEQNELKRALGPVHLIALGIGAIIGAGIFVLTGHAAASYAGSGVVISFAIAGLGCLFAGLCYAEYAAMIPVAGSAYTYTYATMGRFMAWIIGWNLVLEYLAAGSTVAVGWSGYFSDFMAKQLGHADPCRVRRRAVQDAGLPRFRRDGRLFQSARRGAGGARHLRADRRCEYERELQQPHGRDQAHHRAGRDLRLLLTVVPANHVPFIPPNTGTFGQFGWTGVFRATGVIFFAYIGFDAVSVAAQEARNPQRDIPIGILGSLVICTVLYMLMSWVLTGIAPYHDAERSPSRVAGSRSAARRPLGWRPFVNVGAVVGLASVVLVLLLGQSRIFYAMAKDGMIPRLFCDIHPRFTHAMARLAHHRRRSAHCGAGVLPLDILGELVSIGTLAGLRHRLRRRHGAARAAAEGEAAVPHAACLDRRRRSVSSCASS